MPGHPRTLDNKEQYGYTMAAHHCIPGNAALKESKILKYISASKGTIVKNIGYNVNGAGNGIWLVGWYAVRAGNGNSPSANTGWGALTGLPFREAYVMAVIRATGAQFHDTHATYSDNVRDVLDKVALHFDTNAKFFCDKCKEAAQQPGGKIPPPYGLNDRLDSFSGFLGGKLRGSTVKSWQLNRWCTSDTWESTMSKMV